MIEPLYREIRSDLIAFFTSRTGSAETAEDLTQETFFKVLRRLERETVPPNLAGYVFQTARNTLIDYYRTRRNSEELPEIEDTSQEDERDEETRRQIAGWMERFINSLPEPYRTTLTLCEIDGRSHKEIADRTGVSPAAVKTRVHRGRRLLHRDLTQCCSFSFDARGRVVDFEPLRRTCKNGC